MNLLLILLIGLTTGGLSCLAMQGGLLASVIANQKDNEHDNIKQSKTKAKLFSISSFDQMDWQPVFMFLAIKLIAHTILGFLLGLLGSAISLSLGLRLTFQTFTALFMFATAMNLLNVHPIFRYVVFQPPKFLQRLVRKITKSEIPKNSTTSRQWRDKTLFAPGLLGLMTIFIPCGVTQAMEVVAINSANPIYGALVMFSFVLGTSPLFAILGVATAKLSEGWYKKFNKFAAVSLILMAMYGLNGVLLVMDSPITLNKIVSPIAYFFSDQRFQSTLVPVTDGTQQITIHVLNNGYQPKRLQVRSGIPVTLTLQSKDAYSCAAAFVFKEFGISTFLEANDTQSFTFTPTNPGKYTYSCSMGMYTGTMEVI